MLLLDDNLLPVLTFCLKRLQSTSSSRSLLCVAARRHLQRNCLYVPAGKAYILNSTSFSPRTRLSSGGGLKAEDDKLLTHQISRQ